MTENAACSANIQNRKEKWADGNLTKLRKGSFKSHTCGGTTPYTSTCWGSTDWKAAWQKRTLDPGGYEVERDEALGGVFLKMKAF